MSISTKADDSAMLSARMAIFGEDYRGSDFASGPWAIRVADLAHRMRAFADAENAPVRARVEALEAALRPFATWASRQNFENWAFGKPNTFLIYPAMEGPHNAVTIADFLRARAALTNNEVAPMNAFTAQTTKATP